MVGELRHGPIRRGERDGVSIRKREGMAAPIYNDRYGTTESNKRFYPERAGGGISFEAWEI